MDEAELRLGAFEAKWDDDYLPISQPWRRNWARITPFFDFPTEMRKMIYTTNSIEPVNTSLRKITKNRGSFPCDEALLKLLLSGPAQHQQEMDDADPRLEGGADALYDQLLGQAATTVPAGYIKLWTPSLLLASEL